MEFKLRANIVISKEFSVEASNLADAMDKANEYWQNTKHSWNEFKSSGVTLEILNQDECIKWHEDKRRDE